MPFGLKPKCTLCKTTSSSMWKKSDDDEVICNSCTVKPPKSSNNSGNGSEPAKSSNGNASSVCPFTLRKSTRAKSSKLKQQAPSKNSSAKGKGRRSIFKKTCPVKAPTTVSTPITTDAFFYKNTYYQVGDIVNIVDHSGIVCFAQIRGLLQDHYNEKSAIITWLLPTTKSPKGRFDPATYVIGPEEDVPRKMEFFEFVCHAPSEYFKAKDSPYPVIPIKPERGFVWTRVGPRIIPLPTKEEVFGATYEVREPFVPQR